MKNIADKIKQSGIMIFATVENLDTGKVGKQHIFIYEDKAKDKSFPVPILGNISICGSCEIFDERGMSKDLNEIDEEKADEKTLCKKCASLYDKHQHVLPTQKTH